MPNKHHHHFSFKLFCLCGSNTGYTVNFSIYKGKSNTASEYGISHDMCIQMGHLLGMGYHLYTDNWYTAMLLAESLLSEDTNLTGTVWGNWKYLSKGVKQKLLKGDSIAYCKQKLVCVGWQSKKHMILLSTESSSKMITYTSKRSREHQCPEIVRNYNLHTGGVNLSDMRC